ncbi:hypothetical protein GGS21DRAFT_290329 [Xylaria nigripes]|nr:hypothetical protein GGS21DRAFT_290329 [Xylaria nigripes]
MAARDRRQSSISSKGSRYSDRSSVFSVNSVESAATLVTTPGLGQGQFFPRRLPCEFWGYSHCDQNFALTEVQAWIEHIITEHLENQLPRRAICWICDDEVFDAKDGDRRINFYRRMLHIRDHYAEGAITPIIRPDHYFNTHVGDAGLVPQSGYEFVRDYSEAPQASWIIPHDQYPSDMQAQELRRASEYSNPHAEAREYRRQPRESGSRRSHTRHQVSVWHDNISMP